MTQAFICFLVSRNLKQIPRTVYSHIHWHIETYFIYLFAWAVNHRTAGVKDLSSLITRIFFFFFLKDWGKLLSKYERATVSNLTYTEEYVIFILFLFYLVWLFCVANECLSKFHDFCSLKEKGFALGNWTHINFCKFPKCFKLDWTCNTCTNESFRR